MNPASIAAKAPREVNFDQYSDRIMVGQKVAEIPDQPKMTNQNTGFLATRLKCRRSTDAYQFAFDFAAIPKTVRQIAVEVIGVTRSKRFTLAAHGHFDLAPNVDPSLLPCVGQHGRASVCARCVRFVQYL